LLILSRQYRKTPDITGNVGFSILPATYVHLYSIQYFHILIIGFIIFSLIIFVLSHTRLSRVRAFLSVPILFLLPTGAAIRCEKCEQADFLPLYRSIRYNINRDRSMQKRYNINRDRSMQKRVVRNTFLLSLTILKYFLHTYF